MREPSAGKEPSAVTKPTAITKPHPTIGVFDSGFGGLTVLRALLPLIPGATYIYLGDTARLPYGSKSQQTIARYAVSSARFLLDQGADLLVIACNTATALALDDIRQALPIPVIGVIQPGAHAAQTFSTQQTKSVILSEAEGPAVALAVARSPQHPQNSVILSEAEGPAFALTGPPTNVLVLATTATVQSRAYTRELTALGLRATEKACPLLVPLVEEGWTDHPVTAEVLRIYLTEAFADAPETTTLVLGCTHYPLLKPLIERVLAQLNHPLHIIDAAQATAEATAALLPGIAPSTTAPAITFYATDSIEKFQRLGSHFLGQPLPEVKLLDLGG